ncbi:MAG: hypothetical protein R2728_08345 [Chitinophagales bacterium]
MTVIGAFMTSRFFQYAAEELKDQPKPIFATLFNISKSCGPYMVPEKYSETLPTGTMSSHQSLAYTDFSHPKILLQY